MRKCHKKHARPSDLHLIFDLRILLEALVPSTNPKRRALNPEPQSPTTGYTAAIWLGLNLNLNLDPLLLPAACFD